MAIEVIGNVQEVFNYALNQNGVSVDKIIITKNEFRENLSNPETIQALLTGLEQLTTVEQFNKLLENPEIKNALQSPINPSILKNITQKVQEQFSSFDQVQLKNYSFMNSMNSDTYSILIRTQSGTTFSVENVDKHQIQQGLSEAFMSYIYSISSKYSLDELNFQIEITRFEEMKKHFYLHKEGQKLLLFSTLSHPQLINGCQYHINGEQYSSYGDKLFYNESNQDMKYERVGVKMGFTQIQHSGKLLEEQELVAIHQATSNLNDVCVEGYITQKGKVELSSIALNQTPIQDTCENNLLLHKSTKKYEDISILPIHEIETQTPNPKYVLIRNIGEYKTLIEHSNLQEVDGLIISFSLYSQQLLMLCRQLDIDCIITKNQYDKVLQTKINWETLEIEAKQQSSHNPFSSLLPQKSQEQIQSTQKMKDLQDELNASIQKRDQTQQSSHSTQRPMTTSQKAQSTMQTHSAYSGQSSERKGALAMLADSVLNQAQEQQKEEVQEVIEEPAAQTTILEQSVSQEYVEVSEQSQVIEPTQPSFDMFSNQESEQVQQTQPQTPNFSQSSLNTSNPMNSNQEVKQLMNQLIEIRRKEEELLQQILRKL